jgi:hypothetical protein
LSYQLKTGDCDLIKRRGILFLISSVDQDADSGGRLRPVAALHWSSPEQGGLTTMGHGF